MFKWISRLFSRKQSNPKQSGLVMVASSQEPKIMPTPTDICMVVDKTGEEFDYKCGHRHAGMFKLNLFGESITLSDTGYAKRELCAECLLAWMRGGIIRCAACGFSIMPGDPVATYVNNDNFKKEWKTILSQEGNKEKGVVGCMRWNCCPSGGYFSGHWMGSHFAPAFGAGSLAAEVFRTGKAMYVDGDGKVTYIDDATKKKD